MTTVPTREQREEAVRAIRTLVDAGGESPNYERWIEAGTGIFNAAPFLAVAQAIAAAEARGERKGLERAASLLDDAANNARPYVNDTDPAWASEAIEEVQRMERFARDIRALIANEAGENT